MNIRIFLTSALLVCACRATAFYHHKPSYDFNSGRVLTLNLGLGGVEFWGAGVYAEYERFADAEGLLALTGAVGTYVGGTMAFGEMEQNEVRTQLKGWYVAPGIRTHPFGTSGRVDLGIGASFPLGKATCRDEKFIRSGELLTHYDHQFFGVGIGQLTCNFKSRKAFLFGMFLNCGYIYANARADLSTADRNNTFFMLGLRFGGQW